MEGWSLQLGKITEGFSKEETFNPALEGRTEFDMERWGLGKGVLGRETA